MNDEKILDILIEHMIYSEKNAYCNVFVCLLWSLG